MEATSEKEKSSEDGNDKPSPMFYFHNSVENHRFCLAAGLVAGLMFLIFVSMIIGKPDPLLLSGIFSGWVTSIVGFYFLNESASRIAGQLMESEEKKERARLAASLGNQELIEAKQLFEAKIEELEDEIRDRDIILADLLSDLEGPQDEIDYNGDDDGGREDGSEECSCEERGEKDDL